MHNLKYCTAFMHSDGLQGCRVACYPCSITLFTNTRVPHRLRLEEAPVGDILLSAWCYI